jgi:hypothetical protein
VREGEAGAEPDTEGSAGASPSRTPEPALPSRRKSGQRRREDPDPGPESGTKAGAPLPIPASSNGQFWAVAALLFLALAAIGGLVVWVSQGKDSPPNQAGGSDKEGSPQPNPNVKPDRKGDGEADPKSAKKSDKQPAPTRVELPRLYQPRTPLERDELRQAFLPPAIPPPPAKAVVLRVQRAGGLGRGTFASLADACKQAAGGKVTVIEVHDNGPLFEPAIAVTGRSLVVRAGKGFRPLLAWDVPAAKADQFLCVRQGNLTLEGLDVVAGETGGGPAALVEVRGGHVTARNCTFSASGKHAHGLAAVRLDRASGGRKPPEKVAPSGGLRPPLAGNCLLSRCFARGADLTALAVHTPGADVFIDRCLLVGGERPLVQVAGGNAATALRVFRSTLTAGKTLLRVDPVGKEDSRPRVRWLLWDALLAQSDPQVDGDLLVLGPGVDTDRMNWRAVNCLYAGWKGLLAGPAPVAGTDLGAWHKIWKLPEGDRSVVAN